MSTDTWSSALTLSWLAAPDGGDEPAGRVWARRRAEASANSGADAAEQAGPTASRVVPGESSRATVIDGVPGDVIVARIRAGDREAFSALYLAFRDRLWRFAATLGESPEVAQELVQDLFLSLWTRRASFVVREDVAVYLLTAVRHRVYKVTRHARVVSRFRDAVAREAEPSGDDADPVARTLDVAELQRAVAEALDAVAPRERAALLLRWGEGRTYEDIGAVLGISAMGAHKMVVRAMARVRPLLERFRDVAEP